MQTLFAPPTAKGIFIRPNIQTSLLYANKSSVTFISKFPKNSLVQFSHLNYSTARWIRSQRVIGRLQAIQASEAAGPSSPAEKWEFQFVGEWHQNIRKKSHSPYSKYGINFLYYCSSRLLGGCVAVCR